MFEEPRYIGNSFNVTFSRQPAIRRMANDFEDKLEGQYFQPQIIPVPDDLDPNVPRMIFGSKHGFSQIIVSQINLLLSVTYSPDWQLDISKGRQYLLDRVSILFELLDIIEDAELCFCGLTTLVRLPSEMDADTILGDMAKLCKGNLDIQDLHDVQIKTTTVISNLFFSNMTLRNYRIWKLGGNQEISRLPREKVLEQGIEIEGDFNDRYKFNEDPSYSSSQDIIEDIIDKGLAEILKEIIKIRGL